MLEALKNHPFGVVAELEKTVVLTFAAPKAELSAMIPSFLALDTFNDRWGFIAMAVVRARALRPTGHPRWSGQDFWLIGYRIFVRYTNAQGRGSRGLYILGSETDRRLMALLGNCFTRYRYAFKPMITKVNSDGLTLRTTDGDTVVVVKDRGEPVALPPNSVFADWSEARRFVGPLPFTFSHAPKRNHVLIVEGARTDWRPRPVAIEEHRCAFIERLGLGQLHLSNAFMIDHVPYHWKPGVLEPIVP